MEQQYRDRIRRPYTNADLAYMEEAYLRDSSMENVVEIAIALRRTKMSVIGKLQALGIYKKKRYLTKTGQIPRKKCAIVKDIEEALLIKEGSLRGLETADKHTLLTLESIIHELNSELAEQTQIIEAQKST